MTSTRTLLGLVTLTLAGCEASPRGAPADGHAPDALAVRTSPEPPAGPDAQPESARPDVTRLGYDPARRTLSVYELDDPAARWVLTLPGAPMGVPVDGEYEFPATVDCDSDTIALFTTRPRHRPSPGVSLREIAEAGRR